MSQKISKLFFDAFQCYFKDLQINFYSSLSENHGFIDDEELCSTVSYFSYKNMSI